MGGGDVPRLISSLDNLVALIDCNGIQADGAIVLDMEPVAEQVAGVRLGDQRDRRQPHGRRSSNALHGARSRNGRPKAIVLGQPG